MKRLLIRKLHMPDATVVSPALVAMADDGYAVDRVEIFTAETPDTSYVDGEFELTAERTIRKRVHQALKTGPETFS